MLSLIRERRLQSALCQAVLDCDFDRIQETVSQGICLNFTRWGSSPLCKAVWKANKRIVDFLLAHGADPGAPGNGPLLAAAARAGDIDLVNLVLAAGHDLHFRPPKLPTPLEIAALHNRSEMVTYLLARGATKEDFDGRRCSWVRIHSVTIRILAGIGIPVPVDVLQHVQNGTWLG